MLKTPPKYTKNTQKQTKTATSKQSTLYLFVEIRKKMGCNLTKITTFVLLPALQTPIIT